MSVTIRVFDPAMCCSTGVCGPGVDPELSRFAGDVDWLKAHGADIQRYNLATDPAVFASTAVVREALSRGNEVLPLTLVDDRVVVEGAYPSRETLAALAGIVIKKHVTLSQLANMPHCTPSTDPSKPGCC